MPRQDADAGRARAGRLGEEAHGDVEVVCVAELPAQRIDVVGHKLLQAHDLGRLCAQERRHLGHMLGALDVDARQRESSSPHRHACAPALRHPGYGGVPDSGLPAGGRYGPRRGAVKAGGEPGSNCRVGAGGAQATGSSTGARAFAPECAPSGARRRGSTRDRDSRGALQTTSRGEAWHAAAGGEASAWLAARPASSASMVSPRRASRNADHGWPPPSASSRLAQSRTLASSAREISDAMVRYATARVLRPGSMHLCR